MAIIGISNGEAGGSVRSKLNEAINSVNTTMENRVVVKTASQLSGVLSSTTQYFLDGIIDMGSTEIEIPAGGLYIAGYNFDLSGLTSTAAGFTLFTSPVGGSGNVLFDNFLIDVSGAGSQVYDLVADTGFEAIELDRINYNNCTSGGTIDGYRQGLEEGTGRFGGSPSITLKGTWLGGYRITTSIVRGLSNSTTEPLFKAGVGFVMNSRFLTDINCDLGTLQPFCDFTTAMFPNPSTLQVKGAIFTRGLIVNASDTNIFPNISRADLASSWVDNIGIRNTFVGGKVSVSSENLTSIAAGSTWYTLDAVWATGNLEHFDSPASGQLRHLGNSPREFKITVNFNIASTANNEVAIRLRKWDDSLGSFIEFGSRARQINSFVGGRDVGFFNFSFNVVLDQNDYVYFQVANNSGNNDLTLELDSDFQVEER